MVVQEEKIRNAGLKIHVKMIQSVNVGVRKNVVLERNRQLIVRFILKMIPMENFVTAKSGIMKIMKITANYTSKLNNQKTQNNLGSLESDSKKPIHPIRNGKGLESLHDL